MQYLHVTPEQKCFSISGWTSANHGHVLLHIDIPNQQVYPLPLLVTPGHCFYLVSFKLPETEDEEYKILKAIRNTLKDVYEYSKILQQDVAPDVFLVGLQRKEKDCSSFAQQLQQMLGTRPYERLLVRTERGDLYWINSGVELSICDNRTILSKIQGNFCPQPQMDYQSLQHCYELLHQKFKDAGPFILYEEVKAVMSDSVSGIVGSSFEEFLKILHCYGFIFYCSPPPESDLKQSENVVVLQPECLYQLFEEVQELSKRRPNMTIADLLKTRISMPIHDKQKWFREMCINAGLVIERIIDSRPNYLFVMGLEPEYNLPEHEHYSINPLLVTYRPEDIQRKDDDYFLPSPLFPAFVAAFLKKLKEQDKKQRGSPILKQHYLRVSVQGAAALHVVERDSFIEIGLQQFHVGQTKEDLDRLQQFCHDVCHIVSESAESATASLRLISSSLQYGFLCDCENCELVDRFGQFDPECNMITFSCCDVPQEPIPQQQIWFSNVNRQKVRCVLCNTDAMVLSHGL